MVNRRMKYKKKRKYFVRDMVTGEWLVTDSKAEVSRVVGCHVNSIKDVVKKFRIVKFYENSWHDGFI